MVVYRYVSTYAIGEVPSSSLDHSLVSLSACALGLPTHVFTT